MRKPLALTLAAASVALLAACSGKLGPLSADNFNVDPNPLETQNGNVPATINGTFPAKYMNKKATVTVIPELRSGQQVVRGTGASFQGEKVTGNSQTIAYQTGGRYTLKTSFPYTPDMQQSDLYLTFDARVGNKQVEVPAVKVATGVIATSELYRLTMMNAGGCIAPDSFQRVKTQKQEANIRFLVNQATLRKGELKSNSVKDFVSLLKKINKDREQYNLTNVEVEAYASPEGGFAFNDKLAGKRQDNSEAYVRQQLKAAQMADATVDAHYTAQDWDGFQRLVQASDIQDKDVILRVLSMYKDPEEREHQIRNMSAAFQELANGILPELRRSRLIINYETVGRSDEQIQQAYATDPSQLSPNELLYAATLTNDPAKQKEIYQTAAKYYDKDYRAFNNLAVLAFNNGDEAAARQYIQQALAKSAKAPEANANLGLLALKDGKLDEAEAYLGKAIGSKDFNEVLGNLNIARGNYATAVSNFGQSATNSAALAQILNHDYATALSTLGNVNNPDAMTSYLYALAYNRQGNVSKAREALDKALSLDSSLKAYADKDLELRNLR